MSSREPNDDLELLGLLTELVDQEDRVLLKSALPNLRRNFYAAPEPISPRVTGLSRLEQELLEAHREDLGRLLTDACFRLLLEHKKLKKTLYPRRDELGDALWPPSHADLRAKAAALQSRRLSGAIPVEPATILSALFLRGSKSSLSLTEVARAGQLITPSEPLSMYRAKGLAADGKASEATEILQRILTSPTHFENGVGAAATLGLIALESGAYGDATTWYQRSSESRAPYPVGALAFLFSAIQLGNRALVERASAVLRDSVDSKDPTVSAYVVRVRANRLGGDWSPTPAASRIIESLTPSSDHASSVFNLFR